MFSEGPHAIGIADSGEMPCPAGPRHWGQSSAETTTDAATSAAAGNTMRRQVNMDAIMQRGGAGRDSGSQRNGPWPRFITALRQLVPSTMRYGHRRSDTGPS